MFANTMIATIFAGALAMMQAPTGAVVIQDAGCTLLDGDGNFVFADSDHAVVTPSGQGKLTCRAKGVANSTGKTVRWNFNNTGILCITPAGITQDWRITVSASGNATLVCKV